jgi:hypothetical protein
MFSVVPLEASLGAGGRAACGGVRRVLDSVDWIDSVDRIDSERC